MLKKILFNFCSTSQKKLRAIQLTNDINSDIARQFIHSCQFYTPYTETISQINRIMKDEQELNNKNHLKALWRWKYNLSDVFPFCEAINEQNSLDIDQINLLAMIVFSHPNQQVFAKKLHNVLLKKLNQNIFTIQDLKICKQLTSIIKTAYNKQLFQLAYSKFIKTQNVFEISSLIFVNKNIKNLIDNTVNDLQLINRLAQQIAKNLFDLTPKQRGNLIGDLFASTTYSQQQQFASKFTKYVNVKNDTQILSLIDFIQQFVLIYSKQKKGQITNVINRIISSIQWQRQKYINNPIVMQAIETNRYFIESILSDTRTKDNKKTRSFQSN